MDTVETQGFWPDFPGEDHLPGEPDPAWYIKLTWAPIGGRMECVGLELRSVRLPGDQEPHGSLLSGQKWQVEPKPLTSRVLKQLPIGRIVAATKQGQAEWWAKGVPQLVGLKKRIGVATREELNRLRRQAEEQTALWKRPGRPRPSPAQLQEVADAYQTALNDGRPPKQAVMEQLSIGETTADRWIGWAREEGFLTLPARAGRPRS